MEIVPFASVGKLIFGDSRGAIRDKLALPFSSFQKDVGENETDAYDSIGLHLYYDDDDKLEFVEAFSPANITFKGVSFLNRDATDVLEDMQGVGVFPIESDVGMKFPDVGIALTVSDHIIEGIAAHRRGYYE